MAASRGTTEERRGEGLISNAAEQEVTRGYVLADSCLCFAVKLEDFLSIWNRERCCFPKASLEN